MNEQFTKFKRKEFIKMWRTMRAEVGNRITVSNSSKEVDSIKYLMDTYEVRMINAIENKGRKYRIMDFYNFVFRIRNIFIKNRN